MLKKKDLMPAREQSLDVASQKTKIFTSDGGGGISNFTMSLTCQYQ
jgi:hypothetical protein